MPKPVEGDSHRWPLPHHQEALPVLVAHFWRTAVDERTRLPAGTRAPVAGILLANGPSSYPKLEPDTDARLAVS
jgi:hypothetical protein